MQTDNFNLSQAAYSVNELLAILPLGRTSLYQAIKTGKLKSSKWGKRTLFLTPDVIAFLEGLRSQKGTSHD